MTPHPWNLDLWSQLTRDREHLPHALLIHGAAGLGKRQLAQGLAAWLLCESPAGQSACGNCRSCGWLAQGHHPDLRCIEPREDEEDEAGKVKKGKRLITVENIRELNEFLSLSAHQGGWRVVILSPAEAMNTAAANALLKTLEEPPARVMLILVSHQPRRLLPTVLSRCRKVGVSLPAEDIALEWLRAQRIDDAAALLREAGGAPLLAVDHADAERIARREQFLAALAAPQRQDWSEVAQGMQTRLEETWGWLSRWLHDLALCQAGNAARYFPAHAGALARVAACAGAVPLWQLQRDVAAAGRVLNHPLNGQLLLESLLLRYAALGRET